ANVGDLILNDHGPVPLNPFYFCFNATLHYYFIRTTDWSINDKCIYMTCNDFDWFVFSQLVVGLNEFDYSQGGMSYFTVVNPNGTSTAANSKYADVNGVPCGTFLWDYDAIKGEEFVLDIVNNTAWEIELVTYEGNTGYDGNIVGIAIGPDDGYYSYAPLGSFAWGDPTGIPKYFANYPDIFYIEWLPQDIVVNQQVCVPNQVILSGPFVYGGFWYNEIIQPFFTPGLDYFRVLSWNDIEEPLPSVQQYTCFCWQVDTIETISQLDLGIFGANGGWTLLSTTLDFFEGPGDIFVTIEAVGSPFARGGTNFAGAYYTHHERTTTETVISQCVFPNGVLCFDPFDTPPTP
ncbi:MAG TPA: hypothetical protein VGB99_06785, partial [Acidobacteriota bacterium]